MERLMEFLDDLFERYDVSDEDIAKCGDLIAGIGSELNTEGEDDFAVPSMGDEEDGDYEEDELED